MARFLSDGSVFRWLLGESGSFHIRSIQETPISTTSKSFTALPAGLDHSLQIADKAFHRYVVDSDRICRLVGRLRRQCRSASGT
jgi:hypothetical protein